MWLAAPGALLVRARLGWGPGASGAGPTVGVRLLVWVPVGAAYRPGRSVVVRVDGAVTGPIPVRPEPVRPQVPTVALRRYAGPAMIGVGGPPPRVAGPRWRPSGLPTEGVAVASLGSLLIRFGNPARFWVPGGGDRLIPPPGLVPRTPVVVPVRAGVLTAPGAGAVAVPFPAGVAVTYIGRRWPRASVGPPRHLAGPSAAQLPVVAGMAVVRFIPGAADVGPVGAGRCQRGHHGPADNGSSPVRGGRLGVLDSDIAGVALAGELRMPLARRLDHPGWLGGVVPRVAVPAAAHPRALSLAWTRGLPRSARRGWAGSGGGVCLCSDAPR